MSNAITKNFSLAEFHCHDVALTAYPERWIATRLRPLCDALEVVRVACGGARVTVLSGYRTPDYNRRIGGARASQHCEGRAADIVIAGQSPAVVHATILRLFNEGSLVIGGLGDYPTFTHMDIRPGNRLARWSGSRTVN